MSQVLSFFSQLFLSGCPKTLITIAGLSTTLKWCLSSTYIPLKNYLKDNFYIYFLRILSFLRITKNCLSSNLGRTGLSISFFQTSALCTSGHCSRETNLNTASLLIVLRSHRILNKKTNFAIERTHF